VFGTLLALYKFHKCKTNLSLQKSYIFSLKYIQFPFLQVLRAFGIPQRKHLYFISVSGAFLGTSLPPTPNWSRFDLFIDVYSIFTVFFTLFIVFLATHCILFIFLLAISFFESKVVICLCSAYAYAVFMLMPCLCLCSVFPAWCVLV
jgi:hypothetical protein